MSARNSLARSSAHVFMLALVVAAFGCGSDTGGSGGGGTGGAPPAGRCYENPLGCDEGKVCAFDDQDGKSMTCLPAGDKGKGEECKNVAAAPECGEGLVCLQLKGSESGTCTPFCDGADDCSGGLECAQITTDGGRKFFACAKL